MQEIKGPRSLIVLFTITSLMVLVACGGKPAAVTPTQSTTSPPVTTTDVLPSTTTTAPPTSTTTVPPTTVTTPPTSRTRGLNEVWIQSFIYIPNVLTVSVGTTVVWTDFDGAHHTVISDNNLFQGVPSTNGGTWDVVFTQPGTYPYHCDLHQFMWGTVIVK